MTVPDGVVARSATRYMTAQEFGKLFLNCSSCLNTVQISMYVCMYVCMYVFLYSCDNVVLQSLTSAVACRNDFEDPELGFSDRAHSEGAPLSHNSPYDHKRSQKAVALQDRPQRWVPCAYSSGAAA